MWAKVVDKFPTLNSHPLVFIKQLIGFCSIIVTHLFCTEDGNNSFVETRNFRLSPQCERHLHYTGLSHNCTILGCHTSALYWVVTHLHYTGVSHICTILGCHTSALYCGVTHLHYTGLSHICTILGCHTSALYWGVTQRR